MIEQEVKLAFPHVEAARQAVETAGARLFASRRLLDDQLFDTAASELQRTGRALRLRRDGDRAFVTFKGPLQAGPVKAREEIETTVGDATVFDRVLLSLGYRPVFRSQKYRAEYVLDEFSGTTLMIDETPMGVFVEIEGVPDAIEHIATRLGRTSADYVLQSYPTLWTQWCRERRLPQQDMLIPASDLR